MNGMITVVGALDDEFHFLGDNKKKFFVERDPDNFYYNEMCGHRHVLRNIEKYVGLKYVGVEHYRRAFDYTDAEILDILSDNDIIVKGKHGPYGDNTNLTVLSGCSRHGINYLPQATEWVERFPELKEQADGRTHYGCNIFITTPHRFAEMMEDEFRYIDEMMKAPNLQQGIVGYFCETILTPYIINKHNRKIFEGKVVMP